MTHDEQREALRMIAAGAGWKAVADRFCGEHLKKPLRERAIVMDALGVDRDAIAQCVQKSVSWVNRAVDAEQYRKHLERNAAWKRRHREQQTQSKREWRVRVKQRELDLLERLATALESLPQRLAAALEPVINYAIDRMAEDQTNLAELLHGEYTQALGRAAGSIRAGIERR